MNAVVELDRVTLELGGRTVLEDVSLSIGAGEFIGVLGANGAGKTSLMRALLGLVEPARGSIRVLGKAASRAIPRSAICRRCARRSPSGACAGATSSLRV